MKRKDIITSIILVIIIVVLELVALGLKKSYSSDTKIKSILLSNGYVKNESGLYVQEDDKFPLDACNEDVNSQECIGQNYYFLIDSYELLFNKNLRKNEMVFSLNASYNYKKQIIHYSYRITYKDGVLILKGSYIAPEKDYTCNKEYAFGIENVNYQDICQEFKYDLDELYYEAKTLISDARVLKEIQ